MQLWARMDVDVAWGIVIVIDPVNQDTKTKTSPTCSNARMSNARMRMRSNDTVTVQLLRLRNDTDADDIYNEKPAKCSCIV